MPAGRYFRGLTSFDLLGNLVPGLVVLTVFLSVFPDPPIPTSAGGYLLFGVAAFSVGHFVQAHSSRATGDHRSFDWTMNAARQLGRPPGADDSEDIGDTSDESDDPSEDGDDANGEGDADSESDGWTCHKWLTRLTYPLVGPVAWWLYPPRGEELEEVVLANRVWEVLWETYDLAYETEKFGVLFHLMASEIDDVTVQSRALRFQAIRNFHRGMWIAMWWALVVLLGALAPNLWLSPGDDLFGIVYQKPGFLGYWSPFEYAILLTGVFVYGFWSLAESFEEEFIEYLFTDYLVAVDHPEATNAATSKTSVRGSGSNERQDGTD